MLSRPCRPILETCKEILKPFPHRTFECCFSPIMSNPYPRMMTASENNKMHAGQISKIWMRTPSATPCAEPNGTPLGCQARDCLVSLRLSLYSVSEPLLFLDLFIGAGLIGTNVAGPWPSLGNGG